jgi:ABC-type glycerol-3-phosphate transport system substrate-binding protein
MSSHQPNRIYTILCSLIIFSLLFSACAQAAPSEVSTEVPTAGVTVEEKTPIPAAKEAEPTAIEAPVANSNTDSDDHPVITFAANEYERTLYEPLIEQFNTEHPEMTVQFAALPEYTGADNEAFQDYYRTQASTGDTLMIWNALYAPSAYFRDLQPLIETDPTFEPDDFWPNALEMCQDIEGRQLGVPLSFSINGVFYDKAAFDEVGLPYPQPGWTLGDFQKAISGVAKQNGDEIRYGLAEQYSSILNVLIEAAIDANDGELNAEAIQPAVEWYINLAKTKAIYTQPYVEAGQEQDWNKLWQDWQDLFKSENRPVMWVGSLADTLPGTDYIVPSEGDPLAGLAIKTEGFAPYPVMADNSNDQTSQVWGQCVAISAGSRNPRAAWTWLNFLSRQRLIQDQSYAWERMQLPARISVADSSGYWDGLPAGLEESIRFAVEHAWYGSNYTDIASQVYNAISKVIAGKADLATALAEIQDQVATATTPSPTPNLTPIVVATPRPTLSADTTEVQYFYQAWGPDREALQTIVDEYNKTHPESAVTLRSEFNPGPDEDYQAAIAKEFDCFTWYSGYSGGENPEILTLDSLVEAEGPEFLQDFDPSLLESFRQDGKLIGLPAYSQPQIMGYNADLLAKRGIAPPSNEWTFDEFITLATQAASTDEADLSYGMIVNEWDSFLFEGRGIQGADYKSDPPVAKFDSPEFASGLAWLNDLLKSGMLLTQTNDNYMDIQNAMQDGKVAFWLTQAGQPTGWYTDIYNPPSYKVGVAPLPKTENPDATFQYWSNDQAHYISAGSQNAPACWEWIKYLSEQPDAFNGVPARKSVTNSPAWEAKVGAEYAEVYRLALSQVKRMSAAEMEAIYTPVSWPLSTWQQEIISALFKSEDYTKAAAAMQQKADDYLACMATVEQEGMQSDALQKEVYRCAKQADPEGDWEYSGSGSGN